MAANSKGRDCSLKKLRYFIMDVDGTLTDGKIYIGGNGELMKAFHVKDGWGIQNILPLLGLTPIIITGRKSQIVVNRCKELGISHLYQGVSHKLVQLVQILGKEEDLSQVVYIGDDVNDLECMQKVKHFGGVIGCPSDASKEVLEIVDFKSQFDGGEGAVRDFI